MSGALLYTRSSGARIATQRTAGWNRQLRITPLLAFAYFRAKVLTAYMMAAISLLALLGGSAWPARGWIVIAVWTLVLSRVAQWAFRRDTARV